MGSAGRLPSAPAPQPYTSPPAFARQRFGHPVFRVVVDAGFSCPVRDGTLAREGCRFCSIDGFRPPSSRPDRPLRDQVAAALPQLRRRYPKAGGYLVYLQPYTNTHGPPERVAEALAEAARCPGACGLVVGTRPDALGPEILALLEEAARRTFLQVEIGVQSTDDAVLAALHRHHTWEDARRSIAALRARRIRVGAHMILGHPWESPARQAAGARHLSAAGIDAVKLHQLQVLRGSALARERAPASWALPDAGAYAHLAADFLEQLDAQVAVERLVARAPRSLLLAPRWGVPTARVREAICSELRRRGTRQGTRHGAGVAWADPRRGGTPRGSNT